MERSPALKVMRLDCDLSSMPPINQSLGSHCGIRMPSSLYVCLGVNYEVQSGGSCGQIEGIIGLQKVKVLHHGFD